VGRFGFLDGDRVAITGHSWGGYSAFRCLADRPDVYRAAVVTAPGLNPYKTVLFECYLDLPQRNPEGYAFANPFPLAERLQGELMIGVGTSDHSTWTDSMKLSEALIRAGKVHEFVLLPGTPHGFDPLHDDYFWRRAAAFLDRCLD
jgi:dipeptidyl aminopeptidase/acylaminoacyl peptidase